MEPVDVETLAGWARGRRVLLGGASGRGKSSLLTALADRLAAEGDCHALGADPGRPLFGPPAAVSWARRAEGAWAVQQVEGLGTLDAGRHRVALLRAVRRLAARMPPGTWLVDAPGIVRGALGQELLCALAELVPVDEVWLLATPGDRLDELQAALATTGARVRRLAAPAEARPPSASARRQARTLAWSTWQQGAVDQRLDLAARTRSGPPLHQWAGRVAVALDGEGSTLGLGQVIAAESAAVVLRSPPLPLQDVRALVVRDAAVEDRGLVTASDRPPEAAPEPEGPPRVQLPPLGSALVQVKVVGHLFEDPLVQVRLLHARRTLLLDLGLPPQRYQTARRANQVSDVFVSHAHLDHFSGFAWLLRGRIGNTEPCRLYGPPDIAERVEHAVRATTWDRIGQDGPRFEVHELLGRRVRRFLVQAGVAGPRFLGAEDVIEGRLRVEPEFTVRAATLDHAGLPVLAFTLEERQRVSVRPERLQALGLRPGPWVGELKRAVAEGALERPVRLPDGRELPAAVLADDLLLVQPGRKLAYATDLGDTPANRRALAELARGADLLICEASFREADADRAALTGHLTTTACAAIAELADARHLVPFHFSSRYEQEPGEVYDEVRAAFPRTFPPG